MFSDLIKIKVMAGRGGDGIVSFRHDRMAAKGGPDGGDGGRGGNVILKSDANLNNLGPIANQIVYQAESGQGGGHQDQHGKNGEDIVISVPVGTIVNEIDSKGKRISIFDFQKNNQKFIVAHGGKGGFGNAHFKSSTRQSPKFSEYGLKGDSKKLVLELKVIADIGLIGLPNSGKSTFLSIVTQAKPKIANYPFTTLVPNLGVIALGQKRVIVADIPGLIAGASLGKGLGHKFLRHVERTKVLLHLIDIQAVDPVKSYRTIRDELTAFSPKLARKKEIICFTKLDTTGWSIDSSDLKEYLINFQKKTKQNNVFIISSITQAGVAELIKEVFAVAQRTKFAHPIIKKIEPPQKQPTKITKQSDGWLIEGDDMERFAAGTDFNNYQAIQRLRDILSKKGILKTLEKQGLQTDDKIYIGKQFFVW